MPSEFYVLGSHAGRIAAGNAKQAIRAATDMRQVAILAGEVLAEYRQKIEDFHATRQSFAVGFFDGFMDRADELRPK